MLPATAFFPSCCQYSVLIGVTCYGFLFLHVVTIVFLLGLPATGFLFFHIVTIVFSMGFILHVDTEMFSLASPATDFFLHAFAIIFSMGLYYPLWSFPSGCHLRYVIRVTHNRLFSLHAVTLLF